MDTLEVHDDIEWVDGRRFTTPDPLFFRARDYRRTARAPVDHWKDPADVYRIGLAGRAHRRLILRMPHDADADLAVFSARGRTIYRRRDRVAWSLRDTGRTDQLFIRNTARRALVGYAVVYGPVRDADRFDAPYTLMIRRVRPG